MWSGFPRRLYASAQDWGQVLMIGGKSCSHGRAFTIMDTSSKSALRTRPTEFFFVIWELEVSICVIVASILSRTALVSRCEHRPVRWPGSCDQYSGHSGPSLEAQKRFSFIGAREQTGLHFGAFYASWISV